MLVIKSNYLKNSYFFSFLDIIAFVIWDSVPFIKRIIFGQWSITIIINITPQNSEKNKSGVVWNTGGIKNDNINTNNKDIIEPADTYLVNSKISKNATISIKKHIGE